MKPESPLTSAKLITISGFIIVSAFSWFFALAVSRITDNTNGRGDAKIISSIHATKLDGLSRRVLAIEDLNTYEHMILKYPETHKETTK
tara:strand:- start:7942 stop:8208 length:267 start_codon:yes stop_codon:yes gene_type:complete